MSPTDRNPPTSDEEAALALVRSFLPLFDALNTAGADYCVVGGLAVVMHALKSDSTSRYRATTDADVLIAEVVSDAAFMQSYIDVYAEDENQRQALSELLGIADAPAMLYEGENFAIAGALKEVDGFSTPDIDVCRMLNGRTAGNSSIVILRFDGVPVNVASIDQLLEMKESTISAYGAGILESSRPQDHIDVQIPSRLKQENVLKLDESARQDEER